MDTFYCSSLGFEQNQAETLVLRQLKLVLEPWSLVEKCQHVDIRHFRRLRCSRNRATLDLYGWNIYCYSVLRVGPAGKIFCHLLWVSWCKMSFEEDSDRVVQSWCICCRIRMSPIWVRFSLTCTPINWGLTVWECYHIKVMLANFCCSC